MTEPQITAEHAAAMAQDVELWTFVLGEHRRDDRGFCTSAHCRTADGAPVMSYPCPVRVIAAWARDIHRTGRTDAR